MFKKVKDLFKKKPSSPVEEKTKPEKPASPKVEEVSVPSGEAPSSAISEKPREQRSVSAAPEKDTQKELKEPTESKKLEEPKKSEELKEPEKPKTSALKPEESKEPKTAVSQDQSPSAKSPEKSTAASSKGKKGKKEAKGEKERVETAKKTPAVTSSTDKEEAETTITEKPVKTDGVSEPKVTAASVSGPESSSESSSSDSEKKPSQTALKPKEPQRETIKLQGLFAFKISMTSLYDEEGRRISVTALKYKPWVVSQIKTRSKEGYSAVQLACGPQKNNRSTRPLIKHLTPAGFKEGARYIREIRQDLPENVKAGQELSIESLKKGDRVRVSSRSKGRGYAGVVKKWGFRGGPASHGSKTHRRTGSIGQCTEPSRVFPGRKMPGQYGFKTVTLNSVPVVDVLPSEGMIFIKGPVSGARNTLVSLKKVEEARV